MRKLLIIAVAGLAILISARGDAADTGPPPADTGAAAAAPPATLAPSAPLAPADVGTLQRAMQVPPTGKPIVLDAGKGTLIHLPGPANTVFIANSDVADVTIKTPSLVYLSAKTPGETVLYAVDAEDRVLLNSMVHVDYDLRALRESLRQELPGEPISVSTVEGKLVLSGNVSSAAEAQKAHALAVAIVGGDDKAKQIVNQMSVVTPNQVNLRVRIAEVDRQVLKQLGINWQKFGANVAFSTSNPTTGAGLSSTNLAGIGVLNTASVAIGNGADLLVGTLDALAQEGLVTDLAEPNMTAMNGQTASFLVGGQFPVPTSVTPPTAAGGVTNIGITYKDFGVKLDFTPTILDANHLNLKLRPEVSALSTQGAFNFTVTAGSTVVIPAVTVTRAETTLELASGQSFALAGLLRHDTSQIISEVPGLGDIPILGQLFRSDQFQRNETELVIIVTPYLVNPVATASVAAPTDGFVPPHDIARITTDDTYRQQLPPAHGPVQAGGKGLIGPAGFRLD